jgi:prolyl-tRNA synthetase
VSTRLIGALVLAHGDSKGLLLPPRVAPVQTVIVPIYRSDDQRVTVLGACDSVAKTLKAAGVRVKVDDRDGVTPGFKFNEWEMKGVPVRLEIGPRDIEAQQVTVSRRDVPGKQPLPIASLAEQVPALLQTVQQALFQRALAFRESHTYDAPTLADLDALDTKPGFYLMNWCGNDACEDAIIEKKATIRCIATDEQLATPTGPCSVCGQPAAHRVYVAKAY